MEQRLAVIIGTGAEMMREYVDQDLQQDKWYLLAIQEGYPPMISRAFDTKQEANDFHHSVMNKVGKDWKLEYYKKHS